MGIREVNEPEKPAGFTRKLREGHALLGRAAFRTIEAAFLKGVQSMYSLTFLAHLVYKKIDK